MRHLKESSNMKETKSKKQGKKCRESRDHVKCRKRLKKKLIVCGLRDVRYDITSWNKNKKA